MTKEWQEATNEYLLVSFIVYILKTFERLTIPRVSVSTLSTVSAVKVTRARVSCKVNLQRLKVSLSNQKSRRIDQFVVVSPLLPGFVEGMHGWICLCKIPLSTADLIAHVQKF